MSLQIITHYDVMQCPEHGTWYKRYSRTPSPEVARPCPWAVYDGWGRPGPLCEKESAWVETIDSKEYFRRNPR